MKLPLSVHARIGLLAIISIAAALLISWTAIGNVIESVVADNIDVKMDAQLRILMRAVDDRQRLNTAALRPYSDLSEPPDGWGWTVITPAGKWSLGQQAGTIDYPVPRIHLIDGIYSGRGTSTSGRRIRVRRVDPQSSPGSNTIVVVSPRDLIDRELSRVQQELRKAFGLVALVVLLATFAQLRFGLGPLRKLGEQIARVRTGQASWVPERQPPELRPVAEEINALVRRNDAALDAARMNAANLAHSLKTPLASLLLELEDPGDKDHAQLLVQQISERVAHHLSRARSGAIGLGTRARCDAVPVVAELVAVLERAPRRQPITLENAVLSRCTVSVDSHDLAEMLGNILENACRHAASRVSIAAGVEGQYVHLVVDDDGPGIPEEKLHEVVRPGVRLDEFTVGYGLGLTIVHEMTSLYGGSLDLSRSPLGGLRATLILLLESAPV